MDDDVKQLVLVELVSQFKEGKLSKDQLKAAIQELEQPEKMKFDWSPYTGPHGGKGWRNEKGDIIYGDTKPGKAASTGAAAKKKGKAHGTPPPTPKSPKRQGAVSRVAVAGVRAVLGAKALPGKAVSLAKSVGAKVWNRLTEPERKALTVIGKGLNELHHKMEAPRDTAQALCVQAAKERGLDEKGVRSVSALMAASKTAEQWVTNIPLTHHALTELGMEGIEGFAAAKVGALVPVTALAYLAYSTVRNPLATWRAAKKVLGQPHGEKAKHRYAKDSDVAGDLLERVDRYGDWYHALMAVATSDGTGLAEAMHRVDQVIKDHPEGPSHE